MSESKFDLSSVLLDKFDHSFNGWLGLLFNSVYLNPIIVENLVKSQLFHFELRYYHVILILKNAVFFLKFKSIFFYPTNLVLKECHALQFKEFPWFMSNSDKDILVKV